mmetsp:Transcript_40607/g.100369  ORF Transcript_40607/g.100369 Transcript_40607/m.100369 type:complete len:100 (-) Transcript_40607:1045-1344(-)
MPRVPDHCPHDRLHRRELSLPTTCCACGVCVAKHCPWLEEAASPSAARQRLQLPLCSGHMRFMHAAPQNLALWHLEHHKSFRVAPQPAQHAETTSFLSM